MVIAKPARRETLVAICGALLAAGLASGFINLACTAARQSVALEPLVHEMPGDATSRPAASVDIDQVAAQAAAIVKVGLDADLNSQIQAAVRLSVQNEMNGLKITTTQQIPTSWVITTGATIIVWQWLNHLSRMRAAKARQ